MINEEITEIFERMSRVLAFNGADRFGVYQARRGWVEARSVVNTWPWRKLHPWLAHRKG